MRQSYTSPTVTVVSSDETSAIMSYMESGGYTPGGGTQTESINDQFAAVLISHFGFDSDTANDINDFYDALLSFCSDCDNGKILASYSFTRTLGAMVYDYMSEDWSTKWDLAAGSRSGIYGEDVEPGASSDEKLAAEGDFITGQLGLSAHAWLGIHNMVVLQHQCCGRSEVENAAACVDPPNESVWRNMSIRPDFAHYCITSSAQLATEIGLCLVFNALVSTLRAGLVSFVGDSNAVREDLCGWLGDAVLPLMGGSISFKWDDYWSDADSFATCSLLGSYGGDFRKAACAHYRGSGQSIRPGCFNRCSTYYDDIGLSRCNGEILWWLAEGDPETLSQMIALPEYADTARFMQRVMSRGDGGKVYKSIPKELWVE